MASGPVTATDLRHRVSFGKRVEIDDGYGNTVGDFAVEFSCRAALRHRGGSEAVMAARLEGRQILGVYVRSSENTRRITPDWRMQDERGTEYAIDVVDSITDRRWVYLTVESGSAA
ncbi:phage head closure protein [Aliihoeflea sp. 40Bstr573]|uniref:phage head closure protein n=1 Tax=Aliihoeflea sp. 40Bstr573 TaxID=2696467 RepID=UPI0020963E84|nr:phage head closure protein [Aliihoeflea sp. 40Bstr573]MCO6386355.1 phage head closure protein [Aliihoeflea sp. 40Bstr573]